MDKLSFGRRVRQLRLAHGMKRTEVADAIGISYDGVQAVELGRSFLSIQRLPALAAVLNTTTDFLLTGNHVVSA